MKRILYVGLGALTFMAAHAIEIAMWSQWFGGEHDPWFLNAGSAAAFTLGCLFMVDAIVATRSDRPLTERGVLALVQGLSVAAGAIVAMTVTLVRIGPGNLFPIVIVFGSVLIVAFSVTGAVVGSVLRYR